MGIQIGNVAIRNRVFIAPMSGVTDEPFRKAAYFTGAGLVVSEMVASDALVQSRKDMVRRAHNDKRLYPFAIQLAGREAKWMSEGAKVAQDMGADIIDINMGCPARQVTGGLSGSALMRNLDHAISLVDATIAASKVPVTLKMRLGWDESCLNAPELARRAEAAGIAMVTVHGRTRNQFYKGKADWRAIRAVREAIKIPLVANGDCNNVEDARAMMDASGADAVMVGRGAYGRPWIAGQIAQALEPGTGVPPLCLTREMELILRQQEDTLQLYGAGLGNKVFRKHLGWTLDRLAERGLMSAEDLVQHRNKLMAEFDNNIVASSLRALYQTFPQERLVA